MIYDKRRDWNNNCICLTFQVLQMVSGWRDIEETLTVKGQNVEETIL